jgi:hypothetical protein
LTRGCEGGRFFADADAGACTNQEVTLRSGLPSGWRCVGEPPLGPNDTPISIELRAEWLPNHQGIGFNGTYVGDKGRMPYTSGSYF